MTTEEPAQPTPEHTSEDLLGKMRDEMAAQLATYKESFEKELQLLKETNEKLTQQNTDLQRALVRSATIPPQQPPAPEKTEEDLYNERISQLSKKALDIMENVYD